MSNLNRGPSIDASNQVLVHLASGFREDLKKSAKQKQESPVTALPNEPKLCRKHIWKVLYKEYSFLPDSLTNKAATGNSCF
jgi:lipid II:glycine glycyltransferase (peptidoglycan interpeptide bridge formation enzyme)